MQPTKQTPRSRNTHRRVRYDRILAVLVIFVLLIVLLVKCCSSCSSKKAGTKPNVVQSTTSATEGTTEEATQNYTNTVYLSPSNQSENLFQVGDTKEAEVCRILADKTAAI